MALSTVWPYDKSELNRTHKYDSMGCEKCPKSPPAIQKDLGSLSRSSSASKKVTLYLVPETGAHYTEWSKPER